MDNSSPSFGGMDLEDDERLLDSIVKAAGNGGHGSSFPSKLHRMLSDVQESGLENVVSWAPHGRSFKVQDKKTFLADIMPKYVLLCLHGSSRPGQDD
jgi:HSF-type DNA-binding